MTFATVAEGSTDHAVIENILLGACKDQDLDTGDIRPVQPLLDENGKQLDQSHGGWQQVFKWIERRCYRGALQYNDQLVIQIDTDVCEEPGFDIPKTDGGTARSPEELVFAVCEKLRAMIGKEDLDTYAGRIHFAVAVHGIECWMLPFWGRDEEADAILTCKQRVDNGLGREKLSGLKKDDVRTYSSASSDFRKRKRLLEAAKKQKSLGLFYESLSSVCHGKQKQEDTGGQSSSEATSNLQPADAAS